MAIKSNTVRIVITSESNAERPTDAAMMLADVGNWIAKEYEEVAKFTYPLQPFLVRDIVLDMYSGTATIYIERQGGKSNE